MCRPKAESGRCAAHAIENLAARERALQRARETGNAAEITAASAECHAALLEYAATPQGTQSLTARAYRFPPESAERKLLLRAVASAEGTSPSRPVLHVLRGLPGAGKSVRRAEILGQDPTTEVASRDDLRAALYNLKKNQVGAPSQEEAITERCNTIAKTALQNGHGVVIDSMNLHPRDLSTWAQMARVHNAELVVHDLRGVPVEVCVRRDAAREVPVSEDVIRQIWKRRIANGGAGTSRRK